MCEPIKPETITLAEAMEQACHSIPNYDLTSLDCNPMQISLAASTAITLPTQTFQIRQPSEGRNIFLQGGSGEGSGGSLLGGFPGGRGGGEGGSSGGRPPIPAPVPAPATAAAAAPILNNNLCSLFGSTPPIFDGSHDKSDDFM
jgi:hypothetical protein